MGRDDSHHIMVVAVEKDTSFAEQANYASITVLLVYRCNHTMYMTDILSIHMPTVRFRPHYPYPDADEINADN